MPQLNPHPWFIILVFSWVIFLSILPKKVTHHLFNDNPTPKSVKKTKSKSWNWPWT